jgi:hypothetical protein
MFDCDHAEAEKRTILECACEYLVCDECGDETLVYLCCQCEWAGTGYGEH